MLKFSNKEVEKFVKENFRHLNNVTKNLVEGDLVEIDAENDKIYLAYKANKDLEIGGFKTLESADLIAIKGNSQNQIVLVFRVDAELEESYKPRLVDKLR